MDIEKFKWEAIFTAKTDIIEESIIENEEIKEIILDIENNNKIKGFSIIITESTLIDAINDAREKANRFSDYLSAIHNRPIIFNFNNIVQEGVGIKKVIITKNGRYILHKPEKLDLNTMIFKEIYRNNNKKLARQLSHFRRGLETDDIITKIHEFYHIIEDQYDEDNDFRISYGYIRHLVSHPTIENKDDKKRVRSLLKKNYIDPSSPKDMERIRKDVIEIEKEAVKIIKDQIK